MKISKQEIIDKLTFAKEYIQEKKYGNAEDLLLEDFDENYFGYGTLKLLGNEVDIESIWTADDDYSTWLYVHVTCLDFEGDIKFESLSDENQIRIIDMLYNYWVNGIRKIKSTTMEVKRKSRKPQSNHYRKKVVCIETGQVFQSRQEAAQAFGVSPACIWEHMRFNLSLNGMHLKDYTNNN